MLSVDQWSNNYSLSDLQRNSIQMLLIYQHSGWFPKHTQRYYLVRTSLYTSVPKISVSIKHRWKKWYSSVVPSVLQIFGLKLSFVDNDNDDKSCCKINFLLSIVITGPKFIGAEFLVIRNP